MFRFTIRDLVLLTLVVAMGVAWWLDRSRLARTARDKADAAIALQRERDVYFQLFVTTTNREKAARQEAQTFESLALYYKNENSTPEGKRGRSTFLEK